MEKIKKILTYISIMLLVVTCIFFLISAFDYIKNGKTYSQVDKFLSNLEAIKKNDKCYDQFTYIMDNTQNAAVKKFAKTLPAEFSQPEVYDKALSSCLQFQNDLDGLKVPQDIPVDKQKLLSQHLKFTSYYVDFLVHQINHAKSCLGNTACLVKGDTTITSNPINYIRTALKMDLTGLEAQKRFSLKYFLIIYPQKSKYQNASIKLSKIKIQIKK